MFLFYTMDTGTNPPEPLTAADEHAQRVRRNLRLLDDMLAVTAEIIHVVAGQAKTEVELAARLSEPAPDITIAVSRICRTQRLNLLLCDKLNDRLIAPSPAVAAAARPVQRRALMRRQIIRAVEDAIENDAVAEEAEGLRAEVIERLDSPDIEDGIGDRPMEEVVEEFRRDLGIAEQPGEGRKWKRRKPKDVALLCKRAAAKRPAQGPFVAPMPARDWYYTDPLCPQAESRPAVWPSEAPIRGP